MSIAEQLLVAHAHELAILRQFVVLLDLPVQVLSKPVVGYPNVVVIRSFDGRIELCTGHLRLTSLLLFHF